MDFTGKGQPLTQAGLVSALGQIGLAPADAACIWTVVEVETGGVTQGFGFRIDRRPQILFERHKFREFTAHRFDSVAPDLSGPPGPYGTLAVQYDRLNQAIALCLDAGLDAEPALNATSWGMGQVMGFNHGAAGFAAASAMVEAMTLGEDAQLAAMAGFLVQSGLVDALSRRDWATFAAGYNGPAYAQNQYDVKLAEQYRRFAGGSLPSLEVRAAQAALLFLGYAPGTVDGVLGQRTRSALGNFRIAAGLPPGTDLDRPTYQALCACAGFSP
jgi:hypothetical protein